MKNVKNTWQGRQTINSPIGQRLFTNSKPTITYPKGAFDKGLGGTINPVGTQINSFGRGYNRVRGGIGTGYYALKNLKYPAAVGGAYDHFTDKTGNFTLNNFKSKDKNINLVRNIANTLYGGTTTSNALKLSSAVIGGDPTQIRNQTLGLFNQTKAVSQGLKTYDKLFGDKKKANDFTTPKVNPNATFISK